MSEFFGRRTPGSNVRVNPEPGRQVRDDALDGTGGGTQDFMSMLNSYFEAFNVSKAVRETTNAFVLGLQGMQRNLVELGMRQVFDQLQTGADNIDNPLRGGFIGGLGQLESYAPELYEFFDDIFGDNDTISNVEFGSAFGIPEEKLPFTESTLLEAVNKLPTELTDGNSYELSDEDKTALLGSDPTEVDLNDYVDARYVTAAEAADIFKEQNGYKPNKEELDLFRGQRDQVATEQQIAEHVDPRQLTLAELEGIAAEQGYKLNVGDIEERVGQASEIDDDDYERRLGVDAGVYFDQNAVTSQELIDMSNDPNVGYVFSQEELEDLVGNTDEAALKDEYDLLGTSREELVQIALDEGYRIEDLTEEEIESLTGNVKESKAVDLIDPRATSVEEVQELVKNRTGDDISTTAAQQILTTIRDENDLDSNVPISENQLNTHVKENIELNIGYQIERMTTAARNLIFGTGPGGKPKTVLEIMDEILEQRAAGPAGMGVPIKVTFDPTRGTWAELKIPVPLPVNGPPIEIPLFDTEGNYEGPASVSELLVDPTSGVVTQVVDGVEQTIGRIKDGARTAVEIFGTAGEVIRTVPIFNTGEVDENGFSIYQPTDWTEGEDYNPWELDPDNDGTINTQMDANGNELTGFDPETGFPVYEQLEDTDDEESSTASPYDEGQEAAEEFYDNFPEGTDSEESSTASPYDEDAEAAEEFYGNFPDALEEQKEAILSTLSEELDALGIAVEDVEAILNNVEATLEDVATTDDLDALRDNINEDLEESLSALGLDIEEVNDIVDGVASDLDTLSEDVAAVGEAVETVSDQLGQPAEFDAEGNIVSGSTGLYAEIDALVAEGASRAEAVDLVLSGLATELNTTKTDILEQLGTTEDNLSTEIQAVGEAVETVSGQVEDLDKELNDRIDALVDQGATEYEALSGAISSLASDLDISEENILSAIATSDSDIKALIGTPAIEDDPNTDEDESAPATGIYAEFGPLATREDVEAVGTSVAELSELVTFYANQGFENDEALSLAISNLSDRLGTTEENLLTSLGETEDTILDAVEGVSAQIDETNVNIANLNELITQYELDGKSRDEALSLALGDLSTDLGVTKEEILTNIGETEETILTRIAESEDNTDEYLTYISNIIGVPTSEITQEDVDGIVGLLGDDEAITDINNDIRLYDANFDGVINDVDIGLLQGFVDAGVEGVGEIPATGLYSDAARRQFELQGYIDDSAEVTQGLISQEGKDTRQLVGQTALFNAMMSAGDAGGRRVDVSTPDPARINYIYDFSDVFATPQQKGLFPSPYGGPQRAQQQQIAQKRGIMSGPLQIGGMAQGGKVDYDFTDEIMQIMSYGDNQ